jgi:hypothetical protein
MTSRLLLMPPSVCTTKEYTYGELTEEFSDLEVHGSEAEDRVYATAGKLKFRLKTYNTAYGMSAVEISPKTVITAIVISR